jgi:transcriptional regulator with XRE-family HTH domain
MPDPTLIGPSARNQSRPSAGSQPPPRQTPPRQTPLRQTPLLRTMLGEVLRRVRLDQGRTLADVARAARVSLPYLSELERGRKEASSEILAAVCAALDLDLSELLERVGRDLADDQARRAPVIRLDQARLGRQNRPASGSTISGTSPHAGTSRGGEVVCLLAA